MAAVTGRARQSNWWERLGEGSRGFTAAVLRTALATFWLVFAIALWATWIQTVRTHKPEIHIDVTAVIFSVILLLLTFFLLTGFEFAYTDLRDKDPDQVSPTLRDSLRDMQANEDLLYQTREWLGVLLIVGFAVLAEFKAIYVPFLGNRDWRFTFSVLFTTFPLVWFAQGPAKHVALADSETFLRRTRFMWPLIKGIGTLLRALQVQFVSHIAVGRWVKRARRNLPPSNATYYVSSLKRYGYALHELTETATISKDGAISISQRGILHAVAGQRSNFWRAFSFDSDVRVATARVSVLRAFHLPIPGERLDEICAQIDATNSTRALPKGYIEVAPSAFKTTNKLDTNNPKRIIFDISAPFEFPDSGRNLAFLIEYEIDVESEPASFSTTVGTAEWFARNFDFPCRSYELTLRVAPDSPVKMAWPNVSVKFLENRHQIEEFRINPRVVAESSSVIRLSIPYPLPAAIYTLHWKLW
jgi:hypothetical protein